MSDSDLWVESSTDADEIVRFMEERINDPYLDHDEGKNIVWNFSSYDLKEDELKLGYREQDRFVVPYQVTSVWAFMFTLLPERVRNAEVLVWRDREERYIAYQQFYRDLSEERREQLKYALEQKAQSVDI